MKLDMRMAYVTPQLISGRSLRRIKRNRYRDLNRRNHDGGKMKIDMGMAEENNKKTYGRLKYE